MGHGLEIRRLTGCSRCRPRKFLAQRPTLLAPGKDRFKRKGFGSLKIAAAGRAEAASPAVRGLKQGLQGHAGNGTRKGDGQNKEIAAGHTVKSGLEGGERTEHGSISLVVRLSPPRPG